MEIKLTSGHIAIVDASDYDMLMKYKWYAAKSKTGNVYAITGTRKIKTTGMHQMILGCNAPDIADHRDGDGLNNRRSNLRVTTNSGNSCNVGLKANNTTGFKGIKNCQNKRWEAALKKDGKTIYLGSFKSPENAAQAYNFAAVEYFGDMAKINAAGVKYHED